MSTHRSPAFAEELPGRSAQTSPQQVLAEGVDFSPLQDETYTVPKRKHKLSYDVLCQVAIVFWASDWSASSSFLETEEKARRCIVAKLTRMKIKASCSQA